MSTARLLFFFSRYLFLVVFFPAVTAHVFEGSLTERAKQIIKGNKLAEAIGIKQLVTIQKDILRKGCNVRICFALDGSKSISEANYKTQKEFVHIVAALISLDDRSRFSAVQYGLQNIGISLLTHESKTFIQKVLRSTQARAPTTFLAAGLAFCISSLKTDDFVGRKKIVVLGDDRSDFGNSALTVVLNSISTEDVYAGTVGVPTKNLLFRQITQKNSSKLFNLGKRRGLKEVLNMVTSFICRE